MVSFFSTTKRKGGDTLFYDGYCDNELSQCMNSMNSPSTCSTTVSGGRSHSSSKKKIPRKRKPEKAKKPTNKKKHGYKGKRIDQ